MLTSDDLERALARAGLSAPVRADEVTGSTNATALAMAEAGAPEWTLVSAAHQTLGRGRLGRSWDDRPGEALMCSIVLRPGPALAPAGAGLLTVLAGAALAKAVRDLGVEDAGTKWPNDLLVPAGKAGGILAEAAVADGALSYVVLGLGVNLGEEPPDVAGAASLGSIPASALLEGFLRSFAGRYDPEAPGFAADVLELARATSVTLGREVEARRTDGGLVRGVALDLEADGGLVVETATGDCEVVAFGEVAHLRR